MQGNSKNGADFSPICYNIVCLISKDVNFPIFIFGALFSSPKWISNRSFGPGLDHATFKCLFSETLRLDSSLSEDNLLHSLRVPGAIAWRWMFYVTFEQLEHFSPRKLKMAFLFYSSQHFAFSNANVFRKQTCRRNLR